MARRGEKEEEAGPSPFRFTKVALAVILVHTVLLLTTPPNPVRALFGIAAMLCVGYCVLSLVVGRSLTLTVPETVALSAGLMIVAIAGTALVVSTLGIPFGDAIIDLVGLPVAILAARRTPWPAISIHTPGAALSQLIDLGDYSPTEKRIAAVLVTAILVTTITLLTILFATTVPDTLSPGLAVTGPDGTANSLPTQFDLDEPLELILYGFGGSVAGDFTVVVRLIPVNDTGNTTFHETPWVDPVQLDAYARAQQSVSLGAQTTWVQHVNITLKTVGTFSLRFDLLDGSNVLASNILRVSVLA